METKELKNLSKYLIREDGAVMVKELILPHNKGGTRKTKPRWLKGQIDHRGYLVYHLKQNDGKTKVHKAHKLVCKCWYPKGEKPTVNHKDGNKENNHYTNLEWATWKENIQHSYDTKLNGEHCFSEKTKEKRKQGGIKSIKKRRKIPYKEAELIRYRISKGEKQKDLAIEYNVSKSTICEINSKKRYYEE